MKKSKKLISHVFLEQLKMILVHHQKLPVELVTYLTDMKEAAGTLSDQITENVKKAANSTEELRCKLVIERNITQVK